MKKIYLLWLAPLFIFVGFFFSSYFRSPHTQTPEAAMRHLIVSMRNKDLDGLNQVCTEQGKRRLEEITGAIFKNTKLHDFLKARGFVYSTQNGAWDVWQAWAKNVDSGKMRRRFDHTSQSADDFVLDVQDDGIDMVWTKTTWGGWKLNGVPCVLAR